MEIRKKSVVPVGKFLAAGSIYITINYHKLSCQKPGSHKCDDCNVRFNRKNELTCHQSAAWKGAQYKKCDCNWTQTQNHLVFKQTLNHLTKKNVFGIKNVYVAKNLSKFNCHTLLHMNEKNQIKRSSCYVKIVC